VRKSDPEERHGHQQALASHRVHYHAAGDVGDGGGDVLAGDDEADLAVREAELVADERQQQVEGRRIPVRERMAGGDQPQLAPGAGAGFGVGENCAQTVAFSFFVLVLRKLSTSSGVTTVLGTYSG